MMKQKARAMIVTAIIIGSTIGILVLMPCSPLVQTVPDFYWGVDVGDEFVFNASGLFHYNPVLGNLSFLNIENVHILTTIVSLPNLTNVADRASFESIVLQHTKVECTYTNHSPLASDLESLTSQTVSLAILPLGGWNEIDCFFPDELKFSQGPEYISKRYEDYLYLQYYLLELDYVQFWEGEVRLTDGVPASCGYFATHGEGDARLNLLLME
jgi:hypothetical protein